MEEIIKKSERLGTLAEADSGGGEGGECPPYFFEITCFFAITLKNYKLCYLKLNCSSIMRL